VRDRRTREKKKKKTVSYIFRRAGPQVVGRPPAVDLNVQQAARSARIPLNYLTIRHCQLIKSECRRVRLYDRRAAESFPHQWGAGISYYHGASGHVELNPHRDESGSETARSWRRFSRQTAVQRGGRGSRNDVKRFTRSTLKDSDYTHAENVLDFTRGFIIQ